jgi:hypothetical protein
MSLAEKKENIIKTLQQTDNEQLIDEVYELLRSEDIFEELQFDMLPASLQLKLNRALEDYKSGRYITHEQRKKK